MSQKILTTIGLVILLGCANERRTLGEELVRKEYEKSLSDSTLHNVIDGRIDIIRNEETAVDFADLILKDIYGQNELDKQKPYEVYRFGRHWVLKGTMETKLGGTFMIIIDAGTGEVVRITHGL